MTHDGSLDYTRELEEARATLAKLQAENDALHAWAGEPLAARLDTARGPQKGMIFRVSTDLGRELEEANLAIANLGIENAILESRASSARRRRGRALPRAVMVIAAGSGGTVLWFETRNLGLLLVAALLAGFGWGVVWLIGVLEPTSVNPREPVPLPLCTCESASGEWLSALRARASVAALPDIRRAPSLWCLSAATRCWTPAGSIEPVRRTSMPASSLVVSWREQRNSPILIKCCRCSGVTQRAIWSRSTSGQCSRRLSSAASMMWMTPPTSNGGGSSAGWCSCARTPGRVSYARRVVRSIVCCRRRGKKFSLITIGIFDDHGCGLELARDPAPACGDGRLSDLIRVRNAKRQSQPSAGSISRGVELEENLTHVT